MTIIAVTNKEKINNAIEEVYPSLKGYLDFDVIARDEKVENGKIPDSISYIFKEFLRLAV